MGQTHSWYLAKLVLHIVLPAVLIGHDPAALTFPPHESPGVDLAVRESLDPLAVLVVVEELALVPLAIRPAAYPLPVPLAIPPRPLVV